MKIRDPAPSRIPDPIRQGPFHIALRAAIKARGLSLDRLRQRLIDAGTPVGTATLSSWQSGRRRPERPESLEAVAVLERVLNVPPLTLLKLLGAPRTRGPGPRSTTPPLPFDEMVPLAAPVQELMRELDWPTDSVRTRSAWDRAYVGAGSTLRWVETLVVMEASIEVDRYVTVYHGAPGIDLMTTVTFTAMSPCRLGRVRQHPDHPLIVAEILLDRRVPVGETAVVRFRVDDTSASPDTEFGRFVRAPAQDVTVEVQFAPDARPKRCWRFIRDRQAWPDRQQHEINVGANGSAHVTRGPMRPGMLGIAWEN